MEGLKPEPRIPQLHIQIFHDLVPADVAVFEADDPVAVVERL